MQNNNIDIDYIRNYNDNFTLRKNRQPTSFVVNFGCQQNVADSDVLKGFLLEMGYTLGSDAESSDVVIFNTCAVRETAENTVLGHIGSLKKAKTINSDMIIGICGCMTQQKHVADLIEKSYPYVDLLFGSGAMHTLPTLLAEKLKKGGRVFDVASPTRDIIEDLPSFREGKSKAYLPIMSGCNNFCSYCVVPYVRGRERSREASAIISEVRDLVDGGYKDITLLGQNVNSYGKGLNEVTSFSQLLREIASIDGDFWVRFMTSHPKDCTKELLETIAAAPKLAKHLHLPVQSGSDKILGLMNRGYDSKDYLKLIDYAKNLMPDISITTDIIVGFPGETMEDFEDTLKLSEQAGFSSIFTFAFSPRSGTKAAELENTLSQEEKNNRFESLLALQRKMAMAFNKKLVGKKFRALVEGELRHREGYLMARLENNVAVYVKGDKKLIDQFATVEITNHQETYVEGKLV